MEQPAAQTPPPTSSEAVLASLHAERRETDRARLAALLAEHPAPALLLPRPRRSEDATAPTA
ncbi:hypothetical protein [Quadrisphaera sp. DSM 44207]|uniref:hypothetical protein n=1 Tax=Quadrisphaera sp. DSM 44207 TaxID=1881057 RepID=UPI00089148B3|nr:hypothetical protein [Quadrisphaera sp. DSM 44207]SDQ70729.1 hypothetical protein SAMN05428996_2482 [Quadrisphaera sp. DSM 44207]